MASKMPMDNPPTSVSIPETLTALVRLVNELQRKNTTMINYYIYPSPTPTEIAAYEPRLLILRTRIQNLAALSLNHISTLIDDAVALVVAYTVPNVSQLAASCHGVQTIFIEHYDRRLEQSLPYNAIFNTLQHYEHTLHQFNANMMNNPRRLPAEAQIPPPSPTTPSLCRGAIAFLNNRDSGKVSSVADADLLPQYRSRLADRAGVVLWWECPVCAFKLRYHASNSVSLSINSTDEVLHEDDVDTIAYRPAWLAKCHIYHARQARPPTPDPPGSSKTQHAADPHSPRSPTRPQQQQTRRVSFTRRRSSRTSTTTATTRIRTISPGPPREAGPERRERPTRVPPEPTGPHGLKYFCPFCVALGKNMAGAPQHGSASDSSSGTGAGAPVVVTCFEDSKELMEHIEDRHTRDRPVGLLLQKLKVAVRGEMAQGPAGSRGRWDLDLR